MGEPACDIGRVSLDFQRFHPAQPGVIGSDRLAYRRCISSTRRSGMRVLRRSMVRPHRGLRMGIHTNFLRYHSEWSMTIAPPSARASPDLME